MQTCELAAALQEIACYENLEGKLLAAPGRIFLDGDAIDCSRWSGLVRNLHDADPNPNLIIVLSSFPQMEWGKTNSLRAGVVQSGGILDWMESGQFTAAVAGWQRQLRPGPSNRAIAPPIPEDHPASWDLYSGSYVSEEEFAAATSHLAKSDETPGRSAIS